MKLESIKNVNTRYGYKPCQKTGMDTRYRVLQLVELEQKVVPNGLKLKKPVDKVKNHRVVKSLSSG